jgi:adenine-specific DNA-methyltransferase
LNYYHCNGRGLPPQIAKGLAAFLNSSLVDSFFRQFSGHTQVNATDLRNMKYPTRVELEELGSKVGPGFPTQDEVDELLKKELLNMPIPNGVDPVRARKRIEEAFEMLKYLGLPREQQNERSALTLLALLGLRPDTPWSEAHNPLCGITPMMNFFAEHYGKTYKPNTRESVRRQTVHQFLQAGLIVANPDNPKRPVNSPKAVYHIEPRALALMRTFRTKGWDARLRKYITNVDTLRRRYAREREMSRIPITITPDKTITLSPGGQNVLIKVVVEEFASRFTSGGRLLYVGDTGQKFSYIDKKGLAKMGIAIDEHGKMPDVIIHHTEKNWLVLVEAVTSHGPVTPKRREELEKIFKDARAGVVYVTAFETRKTMVKYLNDISWDTEVWVAESPSHLIHFNGERFLGPYPQDTV